MYSSFQKCVHNPGKPLINAYGVAFFIGQNVSQNLGGPNKGGSNQMASSAQYWDVPGI